MNSLFGRARLFGAQPALYALGMGALSLCALSLCACASKQEIIRVTSEGRTSSDAEVDEDPWKLLPSGAVIWLRADAQALFSSEVGPSVTAFLDESLPFAAGAGLDPKADVDFVVGGMYATVGSDAVAICKGRFKKQAIADAIKKSPKTKLGLPIQTMQYSGATMYVVEQMAMSVLTEETLVFGTQLGVRRALERVEEGRLGRSLPSWYEALLTEGAAQFHLGIDLDSQPVPAAFGDKLSFLKGLRAARILGNFREPGLNMAGTLTYTEPSTAKAAAEELLGARDDLGKYALLMAALNIPQPIDRLEAQATDKDTQIAIELEGTALARILENASQFAAGGEAAEWLPN